MSGALVIILGHTKSDILRLERSNRPAIQFYNSIRLGVNKTDARKKVAPNTHRPQNVVVISTPKPPPLPPEETQTLGTGAATFSALWLAAYPVAIGYLSSSAARSDAAGAALTGSPMGLIASASFELLVFGLVFAAASLPHRRLLGGPYFRGFRLASVGRGFAYSILLRLGIGVATFAAITALSGITGQSVESLGGAAQPDVGALVDIETLGQDPVYLTLNLTVVSFILGGLREELWRAALFACLIARFPALDRSPAGQLLMAASVAVVFGLGHLGQGVAAVFLTGALGLGLGWILLRARSAWDAVFAHGFFNATSFAALVALQRVAPDLLPQ